MCLSEGKIQRENKNRRGRRRRKERGEKNTRERKDEKKTIRKSEKLVNRFRRGVRLERVDKYINIYK